MTGIKVRGQTHTAPWLRFADIAGGGRIEWSLADTPNGWGTDLSDAPPSFAP